MEFARKIIDALLRGVPPQELAKEFPWEEIMGDSALELLKSAQRSPDNQHSFQILAYLFRVANDNDIWFAAEVLSQTVRHPIISSEERKMILANLRNLLDKIKNQMSVEPPTQENLRKYWLMEGGFYTVSGATLNESGKVEEANQNYSIAQGIFEQLGLIGPGTRASSSIRTQPVLNNLRDLALEKKPILDAKSEMGPSGEEQESNQPAQTSEEHPVSVDPEAFHPLPDVWIENGQLHQPAVKKADRSDEIHQQVLQIEQQSEILAGIQLQIQMYLKRRTVLAKEVQSLEKKTVTLRATVARLEKKVDEQ